MEFLDAFHEGDSERILRCWKYMFPHFFTTGHTKYALEAFNSFSLFHAAALPRVAHQTIWSRTVNTHNQCLKKNISDFGANVKENTVVYNSKSLKGLLDVFFKL